MRIKHKPWAKEYIKENDSIYINSQEELEKFVSSSDKLHMEIGCGKGRFIREKARNNPQINFIAVEKFESVVVMATKDMEDMQPSNLRYLVMDIDEAKDNEALKNNVDCIYLNFSDPWPKSRHTKRRLTYPAKLKLYETLLKDGGHIEQKTDNQALFEYSLSAFSHENWNLDDISLNLHETDRENIMTEYEEKFSKKGFRINYVKASKEKYETH